MTLSSAYSCHVFAHAIKSLTQINHDFKFIFFTNSAVVAWRSRVLFKFLNYVTDKIVRVVLTTLALMLRCVETICVSVRERPRAGESRRFAFCK